VVLTRKKNFEWGLGSMAQTVEHLPSKHKALSSNPHTGGEKKDSGWTWINDSFLLKLYINTYIIWLGAGGSHL
jgi:hypothetical protein